MVREVKPSPNRAYIGLAPAVRVQEPGRPPRRAYTLTEAEWLALGGTEAPADGYPPLGLTTEAYETVALTNDGRTTGHTTMWKVHGGAVPTFHNALPIWLAVAKRLNVAMLTISWPDPHAPDITARER